ncbi:MAG TPA: ATP-dependent DNA ligase [Burkholderiales bacterium]|nr:ATP-dependent DNA ligase [Burkholderiales bacterium]
MTELAALVRTSSAVTATASRTAKIGALAALLRQVRPDELPIAIAFMSGEARQGKLAVGSAALREALVAPSPQPALTLHEVDEAFETIKQARGKGSPERKLAVLRSLFARADAEEQDFLQRLIRGELRQGALEGLLLEALALAAGAPPERVRRAASFAGSMVPVAQAVLAHGPAALERFSVQLMQPVTPMLAQPAADIESALRALGSARLDWKLDGARVQVHKSMDAVRVYTRSLNDVTAAVPEVVAAVHAAPAATAILDGEAIALRPDGRPYPFQTTMRRLGRREDHAESRETLPLSVFFFDCLLLDGAPLVDAPLEARREALVRAVRPEHVVPSLVTSDAGEARAFYEQALRAGHEGAMVKAPGSPYEAGRRGANWLKVKREHTLDLVVLAAEWGHGRRRGRLSNLHLGARDPERGAFAMLGKTFKGLTDEMLAWQTRELLERQRAAGEGVVHVRPELVVEVAFNDIQASPQYPAGMALRFARVKRYRPDKTPDEADSIDTVRRLFEAQS